MRAVVTRVLKAEVVIGKETYSDTGEGLLVLVGSQSGDSEKDLEYIADKIMNLRIFEDDMGKMNRSILDRGGEIMLVSQFTLLGDARKGRRPSFIEAGSPDDARPVFDALVEKIKGYGLRVGTGVFQEHMEVMSVNDGPVTILLDSRKVF